MPAGVSTTIAPHVVVAGAGPVGCVAAAVLAKNNVRVTLLEAAPSLPVELRASTFHPATLELLRPYGIVDKMVSRGLIARHFAYRDRRSGVVARFDLGELGDITNYPFRLQCEQFKLCQILLEQFASNPLIDVRFSSAIGAVEPRSEGAAAVLTSGETIEADAVIGADGASSAVRKSLGCRFDGMTYADRYLVVSTPYELSDHLADLSYVNYVSDPDEWMVLLRTVDLWRALFPVFDGETDEQALSDESAERRFQGVVAKPTAYEVAHRTIYRVHQRVADQFRVGRVVLVGDAAHINNPLGGMGMNGGVHDAVLLAGGLAGLLHGTVSDERFSEYAELRRRLALDFVQKHTHANAVTLTASDPAVRKEALEQMTERAATAGTAHDYMLQASMIKAVWAMETELRDIGAYPFD
ncbi:MAG: FAD-dependent monooxygenase [Acidimicrobiaceae bacterium]|jgi:3-(3-hydroxy-phenyl)propionate hydroxylase|nr:FAD-dependent monooxygenase [Acidimicrobiaceae bacterium]MBT5579974.1 FAD-dependent monooxygenase [Acidimicrobiaceae bacterium]MBT5850534.1 FAD-dependent monooxygenase [Acidimicrobiaceae bacterium]